MWYGVGWGKGVGAVTRRRRIDAYGKTNKVSSKYFQCFRKPSRNSPFTDVKVTDANENVKFFLPLSEIISAQFENIGNLLLTRSSLLHKEWKGKLISGIPHLITQIHFNRNNYEFSPLKHVLYIACHKYFYLGLEGLNMLSANKRWINLAASFQPIIITAPSYKWLSANGPSNCTLRIKSLW